MLIEKSTATAKKAVELQKYHIGSSLQVVGTISTAIIIEQPTEEVILDSPGVINAAFEADDTKWAQKTSGAIAWQLDADNMDLTVDGSLGWVRFNKTGADDVGVNHKW